jgi:Cys-rich four helix bundle protein (predicted Tat secretion target)
VQVGVEKEAHYYRFTSYSAPYPIRAGADGHQPGLLGRHAHEAANRVRLPAGLIHDLLGEQIHMRRRDILTTAAGLAAAGTFTAEAQRSDIHPAKYKALQESASKCVSTGEDCLRHCLGMMLMKDTTMAACANSIVQLIAACRALQTLASVNSPFTPAFAKETAAVCLACDTECRKFADIAVCKACGDACKTCADECRKVGAGA